MARFGLELRPKLVPVYKMRPDQRGNQRNDEGNRQSEQRRLHGVSPRARSSIRSPAAATLKSAPEQHIYRVKYGEVTAPSRDFPRLLTSQPTSLRATSSG